MTVPREDPRDLTDEELFDAVFVAPNIPLLCHMVHLSRAWQACHPYGALAAALAVAPLDAPDAIIDAGVGDGDMPLNLVLGLVGPPGAGKGLAASSRFMIPGTPPVPAPANGAPFVGGQARINTMPSFTRSGKPASGEALVNMFFEANPNYGAGSTTGSPSGIDTSSKWIRNGKAVLINWGEIDQMAAKMQTKGSTLEPVMRSGWSGEELGDVSMTRLAQGLPCTVAAGTYRLVIVVGVQPEKAAALFDAAGGTLQRVIWLPVLDPEKLSDPAELRAAKAAAFTAMGLPVPADLRRAKRPSLYIPGPSTDITVADDVLDDFQRLAGTPCDPDDTHANANRLRVAAIYSGWVQRPGQPCVIDMDAWMWAGYVMEVSRRTRNDVKGGINRGKTRTARELGVLDGHRAQARKETLDAEAEANLARQAETIRDLVTRKPGLTSRELNSYRSRKDRAEAAIDDVLAEAETFGYITPVQVIGGNGRAKIVWNPALAEGAA